MQERIHTIPTEDGTLLHVWDVGEGPPILALHGIPEDHTSYDRLVPLLAGRARLLLPDLRGFGESRRAHLRPPLTPATLAQDAATVLRALELADPILLGHDLGGYAALDALQRQLIRPRALILLNTTYKKVHLTGSPQMALFCLPYIGRRLLRLLGPRLADLAFRRGLADPSKLDAVRVERCRQLCSDPATLESMADLYDGFRKSAFEKLAHPDRRPHPLSLPALLLWGERDRFLDPRLKDWLAHLLPGLQVVSFQTAGHFPHQETPDLVAAAIHTFLDHL